MLIINNDIIIKDYFWLKKMIDSIEYNKLIGLRTDFYIMAKFSGVFFIFSPFILFR